MVSSGLLRSFLCLKRRQAISVILLIAYRRGKLQIYAFRNYASLNIGTAEFNKTYGYASVDGNSFEIAIASQANGSTEIMVHIYYRGLDETGKAVLYKAPVGPFVFVPSNLKTMIRFLQKHRASDQSVHPETSALPAATLVAHKRSDLLKGYGMKLVDNVMLATPSTVADHNAFAFALFEHHDSNRQVALVSNRLPGESSRLFQLLYLLGRAAVQELYVFFEYALTNLHHMETPQGLPLSPESD